MPIVFEVTAADVQRLDAMQLTLLLECLLESELMAHGVAASALSISLEINVKDGGEDASVELPEGTAATDWLPPRETLFQSKAGKMPPNKFVSELFESIRPGQSVGRKSVEKSKSDGSERHVKHLKTRVQAVLSRGGTYVLFYAHTCNKNQKKERIAAMQAALAKVFDGRTMPVRIYDATDIKRWANRHFAAIARVGQMLGKSSDGFRTWGQLNGLSEHKIPYQTSPEIDNYMRRLRSQAATKGTAQRLVGLPGLGKTRLVLEAFRPPQHVSDDPLLAILSGAMVYIDASNISNVVERVQCLQNREVSGIVVVDNCGIADHEALTSIVKHERCNLRLLTIDYHVAGESVPNVLRLGPSPPESIRSMVQATHPTLKPIDVEAIVRYADGFPKIVTLLQDVDLDQDLKLGPLTTTTLVERLVWGRREDKSAIDRDLIEACALFIHFGFSEDASDERRFIAEQICRPRMDADEFFKRSQFFLDRGILDRVGIYVRVSPLPLALSLCEAWWKKTSPELQRKLFESEEMPSGLRAALGRQFTSLGSVEQAREMVRRLTEPDAPFGRAEVLFTASGAAVFRSFVEVDPKRTMEVLDRELGGLSHDELRAIRIARRDLVSALELLAFHKEQFVGAARLLLRLAAAENEQWGNNATGQFLQLFQPLLAGTEAPPEMRIAVIDEVLGSDEPLLRGLAIQALGRAIRNDGYGRSGSAEMQGGQRLKDWYPTVYRELFDYFNAATDRLALIGSEESLHGSEARKALTDGMRHLLSYGRIDSVEKAIKEIHSKRRRLWLEATESLQDAKRYELKDAFAEIIQRVDALLRVLSPTTFADRFRLIISEPPFSTFQDGNDGGLVDVGAQNARDFADETAQDECLVQSAIELASGGEQRQAFAFGERLAQVVNGSEDLVIDAWLREPGGGRSFNPSLVAGMIYAIRKRNSVAASKLLADIVASAVHFESFAWLIAATQPVETDTDLLLPGVMDGRIHPTQMIPLSYGGTLSNFRPSYVASFFDAVASHGIEGAAVALFVLWMYCGADSVKWNGVSTVLRSIALRDDIFDMPDQTQLTRHAIERTLLRLLSGTSDGQLARHLTHRLIQAARSTDLSVVSNDSYRTVLATLLQDYTEACWPIVKHALSEGDALFRMRFLSLLEKRRASDLSETSALLLVGSDALLQWAAEDPQVAAPLLARELPMFEEIDGQRTLCPALKTLVAKHGSTSGVLANLELNLHEYGFVGSAVPILESRLEFIRSFVDDKSGRVRSWAKKANAEFEEQLRRQHLRDEEHRAGIFRPPY